MHHLKLTETLTAKLARGGSIEVLCPLTVKDFLEVENVLMLSHSHKISYWTGNNQEWIAPGQFLFVPSQRPITITYGDPDVGMRVTYDTFLHHVPAYISKTTSRDNLGGATPHLSYLIFDAHVLDTVNLFAALNSPVCRIESDKLWTLLDYILAENAGPENGAYFVKNKSMGLVAVELLRHIYNSQTGPRALHLLDACYKDRRFVNILTYIQNNLGKDLSNATLANVGNISKDYVGQYFKVLTQERAQYYVENRRLEASVRLLRESTKNINEIARAVGFKDTAYFCRRFKARLGTKPSKTREIVRALARAL